MHTCIHTYLHTCIYTHAQLRALIEAGADPLMKNEYDETPLDMAKFKVCAVCVCVFICACVYVFVI